MENRSEDSFRKFQKKAELWLEEVSIRLAIKAGHAIEKHVCENHIKAQEYLNQINTQRTLNSEFVLKKRSSFANPEALVFFVIKAIRENKLEINDWVSSSEDFLLLSYYDPEIQDTILTVGIDESNFDHPTTIQIVLAKKAYLPTGYYVLTAYPSDR